jgi:hypothetical protein
MYRNPPTSVLCQGDVVTEFPYPVLNDLEFRKRDFVAQLRVKSGPLIVVSHDCDLELYAGVPKRMAIQLCPLAPIPKQLKHDTAALDHLKTNKVVPETPEYINLFYLTVAGSDGILEEDMVADISLIHSLPSSPLLLDRLLAAKKLELLPEIRSLLQDKLMYQYGRENLRNNKTGKTE